LASVHSRPSGRPPRILIVEDEPFIALLIEETVRHLGYRVRGIANNLAKAHLEISKGGFDAVLLDLNINGNCGPELADRLAKFKVPFAFITGFDYLVESRHELVPVLQKPFTPAQLSALLISLTGHQSDRRQSELLS
jgi:CheY-like chemotaxis protein